MMECVKEFWEAIDGVGEVFNVKDEYVTLECKDASELNERVSREEVKK